MGIVDENGVILTGGGNHFHAALHALHLGQRSGGILQGNAQLHGNAQYAQHISHGELTGDTHIHRYPLFTTDCGKADTVGSHHHILCPQRSVAAHGQSQHRCGTTGQQTLRPGIISIDHRPTATTEQNGLGIAVGFHGLVEIQMILRQIGKGCHIEGNTRHPVQFQRVAGNFHNGIATACIPHPGKQRLQFDAFRGGTLGGDDLITNMIFHCADQTHLCALDLLQHLLQQPSGGGLSVGAGDTHHHHTFRRATIEIGAQQRQCQTVRRHQHIGHIHLRLFSGNHHNGALFHSHRDKPVAIAGKAGHRHEQTAGLHFSGIANDRSHLQLGICVKLQYFDSLKQSGKFHKYLLLRNINHPEFGYRRILMESQFPQIPAYPVGSVGR